MTRWGMVIDLDRCIGCQACVVGCKAENNVPVVPPEQARERRLMLWMELIPETCKENPCMLAQRGPVNVGASPASPNPEPRHRTLWPARSPKASRLWVGSVSDYTAHMCSIQGNTSARRKQAQGQAKWYAPHPLWLLMPARASELTCRRRQRYKDAMLSPGGGGSGGALPQTPGQKCRLIFLSAAQRGRLQVLTKKLY